MVSGIAIYQCRLGVIWSFYRGLYYTHLPSAQSPPRDLAAKIRNLAQDRDCADLKVLLLWCRRIGYSKLWKEMQPANALLTGVPDEPVNNAVDNDDVLQM